VSLNWEVEALP